MCPQVDRTFWVPDGRTRELQIQDQVHLADRGTVSTALTLTFDLDRGPEKGADDGDLAVSLWLAQWRMKWRINATESCL